jgi:MFS family permease
MRYVALTWQVFQLTGSVAAVGLLGLAEVVPLIALSVFAGTAADRADRRKLLQWCQVGSVATSLGLALTASTDAPPLALIYGLAAAGAAIDSLDRPTRAAMIPNLVGQRLLAPAMALRQMTFQIAYVIGPAVGGLLIASFDVAIIYLIDAASFLAVLLSLRWVPASAPSAVTGSTWRAVVEGLTFSLRTPLILSTFGLDLVAMIFGMPRAVFPAVADEILDIGAAGVGLLYAAPAIGAFLGAITSGWVGRIERQGVAVIASVVAWGVSITAFGVAVSSLWLGFSFLVIAGAADVASAVFRSTILHTNTPDELRGRVTAVNMLIVAGGPRLGDVEAGAMARLIGIQSSIIFGGVACLVGAAAVASASPSLRRQRAHPEPADAAA